MTRPKAPGQKIRVVRFDSRTNAWADWYQDFGFDDYDRTGRALRRVDELNAGRKDPTAMYYAAVDEDGCFVSPAYVDPQFDRRVAKLRARP